MTADNRPKTERNDAIREMREQGVGYREIGRAFGISGKRVKQIVHPQPFLAKKRARYARRRASESTNTPPEEEAPVAPPIDQHGPLTLDDIAEMDQASVNENWEAVQAGMRAGLRRHDDAPPASTTPPPGPAPSRAGLTLESASRMSMAEVNHHWDEIKGLMKGSGR